MEVSGLVFQISSPAAKVGQFSGGILRVSSVNSKNSIPNLRLSYGVPSSSLSATTNSTTSGFCDNGHLDYYNDTTTQNKKKLKSMEKELTCTKKTLKKKLKLIKGLSKNLAAFSDMGFGLDHDDADSGQADQGLNMCVIYVQEARELLLGQLQLLRREEMELKRKKGRVRGAGWMMEKKKRMGEEEESSSSSSSDSECEGEDSLKSKTPFVSKGLGLEEQQSSKKKIEVCMGGKCKKSGAGSLLDEFHKAVGGGEVVVGCKCMGKCRDGPNVRLVIDDAESNPPLCIGVGLEDVGLIVSNFIGGGNKLLTMPM